MRVLRRREGRVPSSWISERAGRYCSNNEPFVAGLAPLTERQHSAVAVRRAKRGRSALCLRIEPNLVPRRQRAVRPVLVGHARGEGKPPLYVYNSRIKLHGAVERTKFKSSRLPSASVLTVSQRTEICRYEGRSSRQAPLRAPRHRITTPTPTTIKQQILLRRLRPLHHVINRIPPRQPPDKHCCRQLPQPGILLLAHAEL